MTSGSRNLVVDFHRMREQVNGSIRDYMERQRAEFVGERLEGVLYDDLTEFVCRPGKRIRSLLFLTGCRLFGGGRRIRRQDAMQVAVGLELLHAFILIHDDIIDQSELRRDRPTLHRVIASRVSSLGDQERAGHDLALVLGDVLFALAQMAVVDVGFRGRVQRQMMREMLGSMVRTGMGEIADIHYGMTDVSKVSREAIERMYWGKTTQYTFAMPLRMAAMVCELGEAHVERLGEVVCPAGLAFQILNDLHEFERFEVSDLSSSDLVEGKKTVLMRLVYERLNSTDRALLQICLSGVPGREAATTMIRELVVRSGAVGVLREECGRLFAESARELECSDFPDETAEGLRQLFTFLREMLIAKVKK